MATGVIVPVMPPHVRCGGPLHPLAEIAIHAPHEERVYELLGRGANVPA